MPDKNKIIIYLISAFVSGVFARSFFDVDFFLLVFLISSAGFLSLLVFILSKNGLENNLEPKKVLIFSLVLLGFCGGILRADYSFSKTDSLILKNFEGEKVIGTGLVISETDKRLKHDIVTFQFMSLDGISEEGEVDEKIIFFADKFPKIQYGDELKIAGKLEKPGVFETENGKEFDYGEYLKKDGINYEMFYPEIEIVSRHNGNFVKAKLFDLKNFFVKNVRVLIPEPEAGLLEGLLLGAKKSLSDEWVEKFRVSGLVHMIVLSGYNITVIAESIMKFFSSFLPGFANLSAIIGIILFAIMTGASATTVRASVMAIIAVLSRKLGRKYFAGRALIFAGFLMIFHNPHILVFDFSFQLSFLATVAIIFLAPKIKDKLFFISEKFSLREIIASTIATQIFVAPMLLYRMGEISIISLFSNVLVLGFVPMTMFFGFMTGVLGGILEILAWPFSLFAYILLKYEMFVASLFSSFPVAQITIENFSKIFLFLSYFVLLFITFGLPKKFGSKS